MVRESGMTEKFHRSPFFPLNSKVIIIGNHDFVEVLKDYFSFGMKIGLGEPNPCGLSGPRSIYVI